MRSLSRAWCIAWVPVMAVTACSSDERPPLVAPRERGGDGGTTVQGGASARGGTTARGGSASGGSASGGDGAAGEPSGGTGGTAGVGGTSIVTGSGLDDLDPGEVYLLGTLAQGVAGVEGLTRLSSPDVYAVGFGPHILDAAVGEAGLYYLDGYEIRVFAPDLITSVAEMDLEYPENPERNDTVLMRRARTPIGGLAGFLLGPDDPKVLVGSTNEFEHYYEDYTRTEYRALVSS